MNPPLERSTREETGAHGLAWAAWPADSTTPVRAFLALRARGHQACLLESVEGPARLARYSFVAADPVARFRGGPLGCTLERDGARRALEGGAIEALRRVLRERAAPRPPRGLPPFCGGWVGYFGYELACALEPRVARPARDPWELPDASFDLYETVIAFDHAAQRLYVLAAAGGDERALARGHERIDALAEDAQREPPPSGPFALRGALSACTEPEAFRESVRTLKREISRGEIFQGVLSQRFEQGFAGDPFTLYRVLRLVNPSPHMFFFECDGLTLIGSSPERLVSVAAGRAENRPIAGTRPRGADPLEDERLAAELRGSQKERAEHDMLVDLARNDLGRVARIGTVRLSEHAVLERFARVQHLVSRVECDLAAGRDALDALVACFPAGTVSGAPKVRAMQLLAREEGETRGPYAGAFGYVEAGGNLDMALVIRTFVARADLLSVQAGAGIVFDSDPELEFRETMHKAGALLEAARLAEAPAFQPPRAREEPRVGDPRAEARGGSRGKEAGR